MATELEHEREVFARSVSDMASGRDRIDRQRELITEMKAKGLDTREGERLYDLLCDTLAGWASHHVLILDRIAYLERKEGILEAKPVPL